MDATQFWFFLNSAQAFTWNGSSGLKGWSQKPLVFQVLSENCPIPRARLIQATESAIALWSHVPSSRLVLKADYPDPTPSDLSTDTPIVRCDTTLSKTIGTDANTIPASTWVHADKLQLNSASVVLNAEKDSNANIGRLSDLQLTVTIAHEIGHALGLGHSSLPEALMYFNVSNKTSLVLNQDDIDGITSLYPHNELGGGSIPFGCGTLQVPPDKQPPNPLPLLSALVFCFWFGIFSLIHFGRKVR